MKKSLLFIFFVGFVVFLVKSVYSEVICSLPSQAKGADVIDKVYFSKEGHTYDLYVIMYKKNNVGYIDAYKVWGGGEDKCPSNRKLFTWKVEFCGAGNLSKSHILLVDWDDAGKMFRFWIWNTSKYNPNYPNDAEMLYTPGSQPELFCD